MQIDAMHEDSRWQKSDAWKDMLAALEEVGCAGAESRLGSDGLSDPNGPWPSEDAKVNRRFRDAWIARSHARCGIDPLEHRRDDNRIPATRTEVQERNARVVADYESGDSTEVVAARYGLSKHYVRYIMREAGVPMRPSNHVKPDALVPQARVIGALKHGPATLDELAQRLAVPPTMVTRVRNAVAKLHRKQVVGRVAVPESSRREHRYFLAERAA